MEKLLTVSVAAYNGAETLQKALDSCIIANMEPLEVLIVDDGSQDETSDVAALYEKRYPQTFRLIKKENGGYGSTINRTISEAKGRYFRTLDCDDWFSSGTLDSFLQYLQNCDSDIVYTNYHTVCNGTVKNKFIVCDGYDPEKNYIWENLEPTSVCMEMHAMTFRTAMLREAVFILPEHCNYTDMLYTFCGAQAAQTIRFCPVQLYNYLLGRDGQSVSMESYQKHIDEFIQVVYLICERAEVLEQSTTKNRILMSRATAVAQEAIEIVIRFPFSYKNWRILLRYDTKLRKQNPKISRSMKYKDTALLRFSLYSLYPLLHGRKIIKDHYHE